MKKLLLILLCLPMIGLGQLTMIPDANFEQALIDLGYDTGVPDGTVPTANINTITMLPTVAGYSIVDLTGIEDFTALTWLYCNHNQLTTLDLSQNLFLEALICHHNQLTSLDLSYNTSLNALDGGYNQYTYLNVKNGNNSNFQYFDVTNNPNLTCISVDDSTWASNNWTVAQNIDPQCYFSNNCLPPSWDCVNNSCINPGTGNGQYSTLSLCQSNCLPPSSIEEYSTNKELLRTIDVLGRETKNQPLFYIYNDGTVEKKIVVE